MSIEEDLNQAHKLLAGVTGLLAGMISTRKLSRQAIRSALPHVEQASILLYNLQREAPADSKAEPKNGPAEEDGKRLHT